MGIIASGKRHADGNYYVSCDVCSFPVENGLSNCPNCSSIYFRKSPNRPLLKLVGGRAKQKYKEKTNGF